MLLTTFKINLAGESKQYAWREKKKKKKEICFCLKVSLN